MDARTEADCSASLLVKAAAEALDGIYPALPAMLHFQLSLSHTRFHVALNTSCGSFILQKSSATYPTNASASLTYFRN
jgi:hypothetical protein